MSLTNAAVYFSIIGAVRRAETPEIDFAAVRRLADDL
jgi:hypothetical protein